MKFKNKGRKIYKTKEKNYTGKSASSKLFSLGLSLLFIGGLVFVGYSAAEPIINYTKKKGDNKLPSITEYSTDNNSSAEEELAQTTKTTDENQKNNSAQNYLCASLTTDALTSTSGLKAALSGISPFSDVKYIVVPLKVSGGKIFYASKISSAINSGAVQSTLTLSEICSEIKSAGYSPIAYISMLDDNLIPETYPDMGYKTSDDGSKWLDNSIENGGKPWASPFSDVYVKYVEDISAEIADAGFENAICADVAFPHFRQSDLNYIGDKVKDPERYLVLTSLVNTVYSDLLKSKCSTMLEVSAADIITGNADVLQPMVLQVSTVVLDIDIDKIGSSLDAKGMVYEFNGTVSDTVTKVLSIVDKKLSGFNVVVRVTGNGISSNEMMNAQESIAKAGYSSYILG